MTLIQSTRFSVPTMTCPSCKRRITAALAALEGVVAVSVLFEQREVVVRHDVLTISREDLAQALMQAHYPGSLIPDESRSSAHEETLA
jgi:copper chaperone CopZ